MCQGLQQQFLHVGLRFNRSSNIGAIQFIFINRTRETLLFTPERGNFTVMGKELIKVLLRRNLEIVWVVTVDEKSRGEGNEFWLKYRP